MAQTQPVIIEAESGTLGANLATGAAGAVTYVTTTVNRTTPPTAEHICTYAVTFPAAGNYELYARFLVGPNTANDDSWYFGNQWALQNEANTGFTNPAATGTLGLKADATLDFETATSHTVQVSVWDGYVRSSGTVTVNVTNENDNAPVIAAGQSFAGDADTNYTYILGYIEVTDADDTNEAMYTDLEGWRGVGGTGAGIFDISYDWGNVNIARPLSIDFKKTEYTLLVMVSDGANSSAVQTLVVTIPDTIKLCHQGKQLVVPKAQAMSFLRKGACLGTCPRR